MDDATVVGCRHSGDNLPRNVQKFRCFERAFPDAQRQRLTFAVLHDDEGKTAAFTNFVNRGHVRMTDRGGGARLAKESCAPLLGCQIF